MTAYRMHTALLATGLLATGLIVSARAIAGDFGLAFEWGDIPLCTTGQPNRVANPEFHVTGVPDGTVRIRFRMVDLDVPHYNHGGGIANFAGGAVIESGAFHYKSPCPPGGRHTYRWTATALDGDGNALGTANAERRYPE